MIAPNATRIVDDYGKAAVEVWMTAMPISVIELPPEARPPDDPAPPAR
jgi:hypothetical protein